uniref:Uncharacterized protein n=1 Tax=Bionectria ochroleuca TaxID=29856 RepID=A0A0B7KCC8_BIOOC
MRKLRRLKHATRTPSTLSTADLREATASETKLVSRSKTSHAVLEHPSRDELLALSYQCFPPIEDARVFITEYSTKTLRTREYTFGEVLV